ncbi:MAG: tetratricopeptide repeat protein [Phormidesmis sp.]
MPLDVLSEPQADRQIQNLIVREDWDQVIYQCQMRVAQQTMSAAVKASHYALMGKAFFHKGDDDRAISHYIKSIRHVPCQSKPHYALGLLYARQEKYVRALCHYQQALQIEPTWGQAAFKVGNVFYKLGASSQAYESYQHVLAIDPNYAAAHVALGFIHEQRRELRLAITHYQQAAYLQPKQAEARRGVGRVLTKIEAYDAAIDVYTQVLRDLPDDAQTHSNLGQVLLTKGDTQRAISAYKRAIALDDRVVAAYRSLGRLWVTHQDFEGAAAYFEQALQRVPDHAAVLSDYANVLIAKGDWDALIESFRVAVQCQPDWIASYCQRTLQLSDQDLLFRMQRTCGRFLVALQQAASAETTAILEERLGQIYEYLGDLSVACDAPARAEKSYRTALSINPNHLTLYVRLGNCLISQGRRAAAIAIYQAGLLQSEYYGEQVKKTAVTPEITLDKRVEEQVNDRIDSFSTPHLLDGRSQLEQRWQEVFSPIVEKKDEDNKTSHANASNHCVNGIYLTVKDWQNAQENAQENATRKKIATEPTDELVDRKQTESQCGGVTCQTCMSRLIQQFSPIQVGQQSFHCSSAASDISDFSTFIATIPNGRAWVAPQKNAWDVCNEMAILTADNFLIGEFSRAYPWYLPGCDRHNIKKHPLLKRQTPLPAARYLPGNVAVLSGLSGHIYYHWMFDVLPRIAVLEKGLKEQGKTLDDIDYFVVNNFEKGFQKETLQALGIPLEKVVASDVIPHVKADSLVVPSFAGHLDWVPKRSLEFLRAAFLSASSQLSTATLSDASLNGSNGINHAEKPKAARIKNKRIYITRSGAKYRHVFNEAAVMQMLAQFGFVSVALETLSVAEQIKLFSEAAVIVAPHGSGLTNLAFCRPGATVIECFSPNYMRTDYWMLSEYLQLNHYYLIGESLRCHPLRQLMYPSGLTEDFSIDVGELRSLLRTAGVIT